VSFENGLGMWVAIAPKRFDTWLVSILKKV